ncbi:MAG: hypothetical protein ACI9LG_001047 [Moritella dasanensis]|jgi:hypothetical protein
MIRQYCKFSIANPALHKLHVLMLVLIPLYSAYELLENQNLMFTLGFVAVIPSIVILAKSAEYARKYYPSNR